MSMPTIVFILPTGESRPVDVAAGTTLMNAAVKNGVDGIIGECGGVCMCATCHVTEEAVLEVTNAERLPNSRLSCQIKMTNELDGLTVQVPPSQR